MRVSRLVGLRLCRSAGALGLSLALVAVVSFFASTPADAKRVDDTPPVFAGLESATTCIPGPTGGGTSSYDLSWDPATDNRTPSQRIVYDVFQATASGGEDFSAPTYTTEPGVTTFATPPLPPDEQFFFVVRARDRAGNSDANTVEREGQNLCV